MKGGERNRVFQDTKTSSLHAFSHYRLGLKPIFHCDAKSLASGVLPNANPRRSWGYQHVGILEPKRTIKFALPLTGDLKFAFDPTRNPNSSQWNKGCVGSPTQNSGVGHVHFTFFCVNFIRVGSRFSVEYGLY